MKVKMGQSPAINSNPVLSIGQNGIVLYSNEAGELLLHEWGVEIGGKLPSNITDIVQKVISENNPEKIDFKVGEKAYLVVFHPMPKKECVKIYGFDISDRKKLEGKLRENATKDKVNPELTRIFDAKEVQSLMNDFYRLAHIPMALLDLNGNILVSVGWQEICTRFHRVNPEACKHCVESDIHLSKGVSPGGYKLYKCKNNMWDVVTPIVVEGQHIGNIFSGQFFFDNEPLDYELFRSQARKYDFNEEEYIAALKKVPRLSREAVDISMAFFMTFANMISQLSYSNIKLSQSLADRDSVLVALRESEKRERARSDELAVLLDAVPVAVFITHDPQALEITGNRLSYEWIHVPVGSNFSKSVPEGERPEMFKLFKDGVEMQPEDMPSQMAAAGIEVNDCELDIISADGEIRHVLGNARPLRDEQGNLRGSVSAFIDITERKMAEEAIRLSNLYNRSLIESSLDPLVTIGPDGKITDVNGATEQVTGYSRNDLIGADFSDYFTKPEKARAGYQQAFMDGEVRDYPLEIRHRDGHITPVLYNASVYTDENGKVIGVFATARDITESKRAEEALRKSEERFRALVTASSEVVYRVSPDWSEMRQLCGRGFLADTGIPSSSWLQEYILPEDQPYVTAVINEAIRTKSIFELEHRVRQADGSIGWTSSRAIPLLDENGEIFEWFGAASDITESKKVEEALRESEERLRLLGDNLPDSALYQYVYESDGSVRFLYISTGIERLNDVNVQDLLSDPNTLYRQVPPEYFERLIKAEARSARKLSDIDMELPMQLPNGQVKWMRLHSRPRRLPDGRTLWDGVQIDITKQKQAEEDLIKVHENLEKLVEERTAELEMAYVSLKESERGLAEAQEMAHIGNWEWDIEADKAYWSEEMYRIFRRDPQELAPSYSEYLSYVHPDDREYVDSALKKSLEGKLQSIEYKVVLANREERIVHMQSEIIFDEKNVPIRVKGIVQDITESKRAEENIQTLASIVESSHDAILTLSLDCIITSWNRGAEQIYGYSIEEILGKNASIFSPHNLKDEIKKLIERIKQGIKIKNYETIRLRKDGTIINVSLTFSPLFDSLGKLTAISVISRDITERIKAEKFLAKAEDARKKEIHHRIKNNLQVISSLLDLQADKFDDTKVVEAFRESQNRVISMALIHEELYKEEGNDTLNFSEYLKNLADTLLQTYKVSSKSINMNMDLEEDTFLDMDTAVPLGIIVNELVSNSLKHAFTGRDKGEIRIKLGREESIEFEKGCESTGFTLKISDNGIGIPENLDIEELDSLGFQLVISLVEQLDGQLEMKTDNGTEFTIKFKVIEKNNQTSSPAI